MNIVIQYDSSVSGAPAGFQTAVQAAVNYIDRMIANPISVTIVFSYGVINGQTMGKGDLGESETNGYWESYSSVVNWLTAAASSPYALESAQSLPSSDPTNGGQFWVSDAEATAYGVTIAGSGFDDPEVGFVGLGLVGNGVAYSFDPNNRSVSGEFDAIGVLEHEITEALGRVNYLGEAQGAGQPLLYGPLDLFHYSAAGQEVLTSAPGYFSINGGVTDLAQYNDPSNGGDAADWASSVINDAFDAFSNQGVENSISRVDMIEMNVLGFQVNWQPTQNDFAGAGQSDIFWQNTSGALGAWVTTAGASSYSYASVGFGSAASTWSVQGVSDFNGDGKGDILWRNSNGDVGLWLSNSGSGYAGFTSVDLGVIPTSWSVHGEGDFNGDGKSDVLWRNSDGTVGLWLSNAGSSYNGFTSETFGVIPTAWSIAGVGDFNNDSRSDILWRNTNGDVGIWMSNNTTGVSFTSIDLGVIPTAWTIAGVGDFNGDGKSDILWRNSSGDVGLWLSNSGNSYSGFTSVDLGVIPNSWTIEGVGYFNGADKAGILWENTSGEVGLWLPNSGSGYSGFTSQIIGTVSSDWHIV